VIDMPPTISEFIVSMRRARAAWDALIAQIPPSHLGRPLPGGSWTLKDIIAHLTWHEAQMIGVLEAHALVGSAWWNLPLDERNANIYVLNQGRSLDEALTESRQVFDRLIALIEGLTQGLPSASPGFQDLPAFAGFPPGWEPWKILAENTYEHYEQHLPQLQAWAAALKADLPG